MDLDWSHLKLSRKKMFEGKRPVSSEQIIYQTVKILFWRSWLCRAKIGESEGSMRPWSSQVVVTLRCTKQKLGIRIFSNNRIKVFLYSSSNFSLTCIELLSVSAIREQVFRVFRAAFIPHGGFNFSKSVSFPFSGTLLASLTGQSYQPKISIFKMTTHTKGTPIDSLYRS